MADFDPRIREYYERGDEADRLLGGFPSGPLELVRTKELVGRFLPTGPLDILDVGGGPGVYAEWLCELGHRVHLVDPIELHVEQARFRYPGISATTGDARTLEQPDASVDAVLLLGPLYHLPRREDRLQALQEACRILRPGGRLFAAGIARFAALMDLLVRLDRLHEPDIERRIGEAVRTGTHEASEAGLFTTAYFHRPEDLVAEVTEAGFHNPTIFNVEGPGFLEADFEDRWADPERRQALLVAARLVESEPTVMGAGSHLLVVAQA
jgi:ubiquinone/menaquinone biosynthesis C-methylase UbiE